MRHEPALPIRTANHSCLHSSCCCIFAFSIAANDKIRSQTKSVLGHTFQAMNPRGLLKEKEMFCLFVRQMIMVLKDLPLHPWQHHPLPAFSHNLFYVWHTQPGRVFLLLTRRILCPPWGHPEYLPPFPLTDQMGTASIRCSLHSPLPLTLPCTTSDNCCYNSPPSPTKIYLIGRERGNREIAGFILIVPTLSSVL